MYRRHSSVLIFEYWIYVLGNNNTNTPNRIPSLIGSCTEFNLFAANDIEHNSNSNSINRRKKIEIKLYRSLSSWVFFFFFMLPVSDFSQSRWLNAVRLCFVVCHSVIWQTLDCYHAETFFRLLYYIQAMTMCTPNKIHHRERAIGLMDFENENFQRRNCNKKEKSGEARNAGLKSWLCVFVFETQKAKLWKITSQIS